MKREEEEEVEEEERVMAEDGEGWKSEEAMREGLGFVFFFFCLVRFLVSGREGERGRERVWAGAEGERGRAKRISSSVVLLAVMAGLCTFHEIRLFMCSRLGSPRDVVLIVFKNNINELMNPGKKFKNYSIEIILTH